MGIDIRNTFIAGRMNKSDDERLIPPGEYIDALNVRLGSTESTEIGAVENSKGNTQLTNLTFNGSAVVNPICIGVYEDGVNETIYWFVKGTNVDMIVSYNTKNNILTYHVESTTVLNFNTNYLITGVSKIEDLLFFTDDVNPPRVINVKKNYPAPVAGIDQITKDDINVIKRIPGFEVDPAGTYFPLDAPTVTLRTVPGDENYMKDKFLCFAYRYRYEDGQYSAVSLFTQPAFQPGIFKFSIDNYNNAGMENLYNSASIEFSTGTKRVTEVDLLYKESNSNVIYVVERYNKVNEGWPDNQSVSVTFTNAKIYTTLGSDELLRLYDNVPRFAKAQTIQGNRLMYGNFVEGYNIEAPKGTPLKISYTTEPVSKDVGGETLPAGAESVGPTTYTINPTQSHSSLIDAQITFDLSAVETPIVSGTTFTFGITFESSSTVLTEGSGPLFDSTFQTNAGLPFDLTFQFTADTSYTSVNEMLNSISFQNRIGTSASNNFQPIATASQGSTLLDQFNAYLSGPGALNLINTGITGNCGNPTVVANCTQGAFGYSVSGSSFSLQTVAAQYYFDDGAGGITNQWEYFEFNGFSSVPGYTKLQNTLSLHSNRDYDTGIVYMDDYGRASTVLTSPENTVFFDAEQSIRKNQIKVELTNKPPYWADKYKFVVKPNQGDYETVFVNLVYQDDDDKNVYYFKLEGDNINKVNIGDTLTVKIDALGNVNTVVTSNVLDIKTFARGDIETAGGETNLPGVYMIMKAGSYVPIDPDAEAYSYGTQKFLTTSTACQLPNNTYSLNTTNDINGTTPIALTAGSTVRIYINNWRGNSGGANCNAKSYKFDQTFTVTQDYPNFYEWLIGDNIDLTNGVSNGVSAEFLDNDGAGPYASFNAVGDMSCFQSKFYIVDNGVGGQYFVNRAAIPKCGSNLFGTTRPGHADMRIEIKVGGGLLVFETEPDKVDPNLFYDASDFYDIRGGFHMADKFDNNTGSYVFSDATDQNQTAGQPLKLTLNNANCYVFGNGVESYKIFDELAEPSFNLGERVLAVSKQDYKEADRFAGMTYSGVYSPGSNTNNLNEFNLGLVNFKDLESSFGPIMKLHSRETDILVLQEDRISYVLTSKNIITDSTGGGAIASVPEVLGTQVARIEEYGISFNPESFVSWGSKMFFTDTKRSSVLMLQGASATSDQLKVISDMGMRSWFRDQFIDQFSTQKLGGYDPYMDEYVLSTNNKTVPASEEFLPCGVEISQTDAAGELSYTVELNPSIGEISIDYTISSGTVNVQAVWNGTTYETGNVSESGTLTFDKSSPTPNNVDVTITPSTDTATYSIVVGCPPSNEITVVRAVLTTGFTNGEYIHYAYNWNDGTTFSPLSNLQASLGLESPSEYNSITGQRSVGIFPYNGVDLTMEILTQGTDDFVFDPALNKFGYLSSNTLYGSSDMSTLIPLLNNVTPITNPSTGNYQATISSLSLPAGNQYLYLVWDLRKVVSSTLCYADSATEEAVDACCGCSQDCNTAYFGPVSGSLDFTCSTDTIGTGSALRSFHGSGVTPVTGDVCYDTSNCTANSMLAPGYYIVDQTSPASSSPKNWIEVGQYGLVIDNGTC